MIRFYEIIIIEVTILLSLTALSSERGNFWFAHITSLNIKACNVSGNATGDLGGLIVSTVTTSVTHPRAHLDTKSNETSTSTPLADNKTRGENYSYS